MFVPFRELKVNRLVVMAEEPDPEFTVLILLTIVGVLFKNAVNGS